MSQNLVSVIIPTYKRAIRLQNAIESVLNQTYKDIEVIVVDDNNDGDSYRMDTMKIMETYKNHPNIQYIKHAVNSNGAVARNTGYKAATGSYICFMDDDDFFYPQKIERQLAHLIDQNLDASCVGFEFYNNNKIFRKSNFKRSSNKFLYDLLAGKVIFCAGSTLMIRREALEKLNGFDTSYTRHQDWEFLVRLFRTYAFGLLDELLVGINTDGHRNYPNSENFMKIKKKFLKEFSEDILSLNVEQRRDVLSYQWSEVMICLFKDKKLLAGFKIYLFNILIENRRVQFLQLIKSFYNFFRFSVVK